MRAGFEGPEEAGDAGTEWIRQFTECRYGVMVSLKALGAVGQKFTSET
jgi:hypothetical protein